MNQVLCSPKIKPEHLARKALVYLRQSSDKQVRQNKESQRLQYDVAERMRNLGWKEVEVINSDLGCSAGIASARREGFERVLSAVALGEVITDKDPTCLRSPHCSLALLQPAVDQHSRHRPAPPYIRASIERIA